MIEIRMRCLNSASPQHCALGRTARPGKQPTPPLPFFRVARPVSDPHTQSLGRIVDDCLTYIWQNSLSFLKGLLEQELDAIWREFP